MGFADKQLRRLQAPLKPQHIKSREAEEGITLHYLEGWHVVAEANRIFGFDGWDREMVACQCVWTKQLVNRFTAAYVARVRITVRAGETPIIREGSGAGEATVNTPGEAHALAAKAAETDATKRALSTFGNAFGLSLYKGSQEPSPSQPNRTNGSSATPVPIAHILKAIAGELRFRAGRPQAIAVRGQKRTTKVRTKAAAQPGPPEIRVHPTLPDLWPLAEPRPSFDIHPAQCLGP